MDQDPVAFVLDGYARFNAGERVPQLDFWHADAEYHASPEDPDSAVHRGIEAVHAQFATWIDAYADLQVEPLEARANGDVVFAWVRFFGHGAGSGVPMEMSLAHVWTLRDGRAERVVEYFDRDAGLAAAGLSG
jgi:ketosteroid isomerase-like protein